MRLTLFFLFLTSQVFALQDFKTDGCSMSPDGTPEDPLAFFDCCLTHDLKYWAGGTSDQRLTADEEFRQCLEDTGHERVAEVYYRAVRTGGKPNRRTSFRWNYGWPDLFDYRDHNNEQLRQIQDRLPAARRELKRYRKKAYQCLLILDPRERYLCILNPDRVNDN